MLEQHYIRTESNAALAWQLCSPTEQNWINEERAKCLDQRYYLENYHFITTEDGVLKSLYPFWDHQEMVYEAMEEEWAADGKCCLIILKPRQTGISTWVAGAMFHRTITMPHCFTMLMAQNKETATHIYQMSIKAYYNLPWWLRPEYQYQTKTGSIVFQRENETERLLDPGLGSELHVANATQMSGVAIGRTLRCLHMSEASRYPNDEVYEADVRPSTRGARDLFAVMESTAYGRQGLFYEQWQAAIDGDGDFKPLFIPVYKVTKYYLPIRGKGFDLADDERNFNERADCMVKQYGAIEAVPGVHLNGKLTLGENLADLGGLWLAWLAWLDKAEAAHLDMNAKTDGYTPDQRFWIAYAQQWCTQTRPEQLRSQAEADPHAPDEYRTNTVLTDLPEFARSFSCKKTAPMVAPKPCRVW